MAERVTLRPRADFADLLRPIPSRVEAGVVVGERTDLRIASVIARGDRSILAGRVHAAFGIDLPPSPRYSRGTEIGFVATGPRAWLALREGPAPLAEELALVFGDAAAVAEQSDAYAVLRLSGSKVRAAFEKGIGVDVHPRAFRPGDAAVTTCGQIGVVLWQLDEAPTYELAVFRSLARSFWHWLSESAAEFGLGLSPQP